MAKIDSCYELKFWPLCWFKIANFCLQNKVGNTVLDAKKNIIIRELKKKLKLNWNGLFLFLNCNDITIFDFIQGIYGIY